MKANGDTEEAIRLEKMLIKEQRERERENKEKQLELADLSDDVKKQILRDFDEITNGMVASAGKGGEALEGLGEKWTSAVFQTMNTVFAIMRVRRRA